MTAQTVIDYVAAQRRLGLTAVQKGTAFRRFGFRPTPLGTRVECHDERGYRYRFLPESLERVLDFIPAEAPMTPGDQVAAFSRDLGAAMRRVAKKHGFDAFPMSVSYAGDGSLILGNARFDQAARKGYAIGKGKIKARKKIRRKH